MVSEILLEWLSLLGCFEENRFLKVGWSVESIRRVVLVRESLVLLGCQRRLVEVVIRMEGEVEFLMPIQKKVMKVRSCSVIEVRGVFFFRVC